MKTSEYGAWIMNFLWLELIKRVFPAFLSKIDSSGYVGILSMLYDYKTSKSINLIIRSKAWFIFLICR